MEVGNHDFLLSADKSSANGEIKAYSESACGVRGNQGEGKVLAKKAAFIGPRVGEFPRMETRACGVTISFTDDKRRHVTWRAI